MPAARSAPRRAVMTRFLLYLLLTSVLSLAAVLGLSITWPHADSLTPMIIGVAAVSSYLLLRSRGVPRSMPRNMRAVAWWVAAAAALSLIAGTLGWMPAVPLFGLGLAAVAEEVAFRYLPWRLGHAVRGSRRWLVPAGCALAFAMLHPWSDPLLLVDRLLFALGAYVLCARTASWILPSAIHVISNLLSFPVAASEVSWSAGLLICALDLALLLAALWSTGNKILCNLH